MKKHSPNTARKYNHDGYFCKNTVQIKTAMGTFVKNTVQMDQHGGISPHVPISSRAVTNKQRGVSFFNNRMVCRLLALGAFMVRFNARDWSMGLLGVE